MNSTGNCVGVDGCKAGWISVGGDGSGAPQIALFPCFGDLLSAFGEDALIAVDMPIGLPERVGKGGRGPEAAVRPLLGQRQSAVFSIPSRAAVHAEDYRTACAVAMATSDPPRKVSKQAWFLFAKIREIDEAITPHNQRRIREVHPELAFWRLNGEAAMALPKKIRGRINPAGMDERRAVLARHGFDPGFLARQPPRGAAADDFLDACACLAIARRLLSGLARPFPDPPLRDERGLDMAIWA